MDVSTYLKRIDYAKPVKPDAQTLRGLQTAHMQHIPFENLDIPLKRSILLDERSLWNKLIVNKRGGFCYELNGLFAWLLKQVGFDVTYLNARVYDRDGNLGIEFDHLALLVQVPGRNERWLADVGFGDSFIRPLNLDHRMEQPQGLRAYRVDQVGNGFVTWQKNYDGSWEKQYYFELQPHTFPDEYQAACFYHQTSPESPFVRGSIISRATKNGRISLENDRVILTEDGQRTERLLESKEEHHALLKQNFGVVLPKENV